MLRPRSGSSNGCDRSGSECHIAGDMSVANFLLLYCFKPCINLLVNQDRWKVNESITELIDVFL